MRVVIQDDFSPEKHINNIFGDIQNMLRNIKTSFHDLDKDIMKIIAIIRPKLEYEGVVWSPHTGENRKTSHQDGTITGGLSLRKIKRNAAVNSEGKMRER